MTKTQQINKNLKWKTKTKIKIVIKTVIVSQWYQTTLANRHLGLFYNCLSEGWFILRSFFGLNLTKRSFLQKLSIDLGQQLVRH